MVRNDYEGIRLVLKDDFDINISPSTNEIILSEWDVDKMVFKYERSTCGCCEGSHEEITIDPEELFKFVDAGGQKKIAELSEKITELTLKNTGLGAELKKYKDVVGVLKG